MGMGGDFSSKFMDMGGDFSSKWMHAKNSYGTDGSLAVNEINW